MKNILKKYLRRLVTILPQKFRVFFICQEVCSKLKNCSKNHVKNMGNSSLCSMNQFRIGIGTGKLMITGIQNAEPLTNLVT